MAQCKTPVVLHFLGENLLGHNFLRIHRSYLVNTAYAKLASPDTVTVNTAELPISRKYKEAAHHTLSSHHNNLG